MSLFLFKDRANYKEVWSGQYLMKPFLLRALTFKYAHWTNESIYISYTVQLFLAETQKSYAPHFEINLWLSVDEKKYLCPEFFSLKIFFIKCWTCWSLNDEIAKGFQWHQFLDPSSLLMHHKTHGTKCLCLLSIVVMCNVFTEHFILAIYWYSRWQAFLFLVNSFHSYSY